MRTCLNISSEDALRGPRKDSTESGVVVSLNEIRRVLGSHLTIPASVQFPMESALYGIRKTFEYDVFEHYHLV